MAAAANKDFEKSVDVLEDLFDKLFHLNKKLELQEEDIFRSASIVFNLPKNLSNSRS